MKDIINKTKNDDLSKERKIKKGIKSDYQRIENIKKEINESKSN